MASPNFSSRQPYKDSFRAEILLQRSFILNSFILLFEVACAGGETRGEEPLGRPRRRWEDNIRMDLQEVGLGYEDWIGRAQDRDRWRALVSAVRNLRVP